MSEEKSTGDKTAMGQLVGVLGGALVVAGVERLASAALWLGATLTVLGLLLIWAGIAWLTLRSGLQRRFSLLGCIIERISNDYRYRVLGLSLVVLILGLTILVPVWSVKKDLAMYVLPRAVTPGQARLLSKYLAESPPYSVTVKVNPLDQEALEYAGELLNALQKTNWTVTMNTSSNSGPDTLNSGLGIYEMGENSRPNTGKYNPEQTLQDAFQKANIYVNGGGGSGAGQYQIFLVVGPRPLRVGYNGPILMRIGNWISRLAQH